MERERIRRDLDFSLHSFLSLSLSDFSPNFSPSSSFEDSTARFSIRRVIRRSGIEWGAARKLDRISPELGRLETKKIIEGREGGHSTTREDLFLWFPPLLIPGRVPFAALLPRHFRSGDKKKVVDTLDSRGADESMPFPRSQERQRVSRSIANHRSSYGIALPLPVDPSIFSLLPPTYS